MSSMEELQEEFDAADYEERQARTEGRLTAAIMRRRDAATRSLHAAEDPWMPCTCWTCASDDE